MLEQWKVYEDSEVVLPEGTYVFLGMLNEEEKFTFYLKHADVRVRMVFDSKLKDYFFRYRNKAQTLLGNKQPLYRVENSQLLQKYRKDHPDLTEEADFGLGWNWVRIPTTQLTLVHFVVSCENKTIDVLSFFPPEIYVE